MFTIFLYKPVNYTTSSSEPIIDRGSERYGNKSLCLRRLVHKYLEQYTVPNTPRFVQQNVTPASRYTKYVRIVMRNRRIHAENYPA